MPTPCISNPYAALACYALCRPLGDVSVGDLQDAENRAKKLCSADPPLLGKFLELYPAQSPMSKATLEQVEEAEGLLQCIWRGDYKDARNPDSGPYTHFKGTLYLVYGQALLLQGPKGEPAVVYSSKAGSVFVRTLQEWSEIVKWPDGKYRPRFMKEGSV